MRGKIGLSFDLWNMQAFNDWIKAFDLIDYKGNNRKFSRARGGNSPQKALLDRFFANTAWESQYSHATTYYLPRIFSDHSPIILDSGWINFQGNYHFKFEIFMDYPRGFCFSFDEMVGSGLFGSE